MNYNDIKLPPLPAPISRENERQYSVRQLEAYAREAVRMNSCESRASTHAEGCWVLGAGTLRVRCWDD